MVVGGCCAVAGVFSEVSWVFGVFLLFIRCLGWLSSVFMVF